MAPTNDRTVDPRPVVIAAGGTGGHVFPARALAQSLRARGHRLAFVTDRRGTAFEDGLDGVDLHTIRASGIAGRGLSGRIKGVVNLLVGFVQAWGLMRRLAPRLAVGFGGYISVPPIFAAAKQGRPTMLHEANAVLGRANRFLAPHVNVIATSFDDLEVASVRSHDKVTKTGNPVRADIVAARATAYPEIADDGRIILLILGGSQGATVLSRIVPAALTRLPPALRARLDIVQQCRAADLEHVRATYQDAGVAARLSEFIDDVPAQIARAHLLICRAGASTLAELTAVGRPAVLVPYPHAIDDHQTANARALARVGGGWHLAEPDFTVDALADLIERLVATPALLREAAARSRDLGQPEAAERLADLAEQLMAGSRAEAA